MLTFVPQGLRFCYLLIVRPKTVSVLCITQLHLRALKNVNICYKVLFLFYKYISVKPDNSCSG